MNSQPDFNSMLQMLDSLTPQQLQELRFKMDSTPKPAIEKIKISDSEYLQLFGFMPSSYQIGIIDWILNDSGNGCCNAVAGSGKSSTLWMIGKVLIKRGFKPKDIKVCVFGKQNATDLINKFGFSWKSSISTLHSAAWSMVKEELDIRTSYSVPITDKKYRAIAQDLGLISGHNKPSHILTSEGIVEQFKTFQQLLDLIRLCNLEATAENLVKLCNHHEIDGLLKPTEAAAWINQCLKIGESQALSKTCFDFTDQLWLAVKWKLNERAWFKTSKFVLIDECLPGDSLVTLADGSQISIQSIVEARLPVSVLSYNEQKQIIEPKRVTGWRKVLRRDRQILQIGDLRATEDHPVFTREQGYIPMAKAFVSQVHVMVIDHEKLRSEYQVNPERAIDYSRVTTWRCFGRLRQLERKVGQCQNKIYSWESATALPEVETRRVATLDWNTCNKGTSFNGVWGFNSPSCNAESSSIYGNLAFNQTRGVWNCNLKSINIWT